MEWYTILFLLFAFAMFKRMSAALPPETEEVNTDPNAAAPVTINSPSQLEQLLKSTTYIITDFHATWCGPCHAIAPVYKQLASQFASPSNLVFTKVDVDAQQQIAKQYSISAMPTFLIFKDGEIVDQIRGANASALKKAVEKISDETRIQEVKDE